MPDGARAGLAVASGGSFSPGGALLRANAHNSARMPPRNRLSQSQTGRLNAHPLNRRSYAHAGPGPIAVRWDLDKLDQRPTGSITARQARFTPDRVDRRLRNFFTQVLRADRAFHYGDAYAI